MTHFRRSEKTQGLTFRQPLALESGSSLTGVEIAYRTWGRLTPARDNAVVICHALTGSADADVWWKPLFGPGKLLDPKKYFIVCSNVLGGCYGTTGPASLAPDGRVWGSRFPRVTIRDQVALQIRLADKLGIRGICFVIGGSMGGMHALEWAILDPGRVQAVVSIAAAGRHPAWSMAWSEAQRQALLADPKFLAGDYDPEDPPHAGLAAARAVAMISYRSPSSLDRRFGHADSRQATGEFGDNQAEVAAWLRHHGRSLADRFDANSYLRLLDAMDTHDLARGRGTYDQIIKKIRQPVLIGSISSDVLYVPDEQRRLANSLPRGEFFEILSEHGHDGFLIDAPAFEPVVARFVARQLKPDRYRKLSVPDWVYI